MSHWGHECSSGFGWERRPPTSKMMSWEFSGSTQQVRVEKSPLPSVLWGAGEMWKWIKVPFTSPRILQGLSQPFMDAGPKQGPALHWGGQNSSSAYQRIRCILIWINKSLRYYKTLPGSWVPTAYIYFLFFFPASLISLLICCVVAFKYDLKEILPLQALTPDPIAKHISCEPVL